MGQLSAERFQTGNHVQVFLTGDGARRVLGEGLVGAPTGKARSTDAQTSTGAQFLHTVGDAEPAGIVDGAYEYRINLDLLRLRTDDASELIEAEPVDIEMIDRFNNGQVIIARSCHLANSNARIPANQPIVRNLSFLALRVEG